MAFGFFGPVQFAGNAASPEREDRCKTGKYFPVVAITWTITTMANRHGRLTMPCSMDWIGLACFLTANCTGFGTMHSDGVIGWRDSDYCHDCHYRTGNSSNYTLPDGREKERA